MRKSRDGKLPLQIVYGVKPRFENEKIFGIISEDMVRTARMFELALAFNYRAEHQVPRNSLGSKSRCNIQDKVLLRRGNKPTGLNIESRMWLGPYAVIEENHFHYKPENPPVRYSRKPIHVHRLRLYMQRIIYEGQREIADRYQAHNSNFDLHNSPDIDRKDSRHDLSCLESQEKHENIVLFKYRKCRTNSTVDDSQWNTIIVSRAAPFIYLADPD